MSAWRPRFGAFFTGPWPYESSAGVGLALSGVPTDAVAFIELMQDLSCNPPAARRILDELQAGGCKRTTVMPGLDFEYLGTALAALGVRLDIIEPAEPAKQALDEEVFARVRGQADRNEGFTPDELAEIERRVSAMRRSLEALPVGFGPYA